MKSFGLQRSLLLSIVLIESLCAEFLAGSELSVKPLAESFTKAMGSSIVFTCEVTVGDQGELVPGTGPKWYHDTYEITDKPTRVYVEEDSSSVQKLYITDIREEDEGDYHCIADIEGDQLKKSVTLLLFKDITFEYAPAVQHPAVNTDAVILCRVSGRPQPQLSWRYKGVRITMGGRFRIVDDGLLIQNITLQDDGNYFCRAEVESEGRYSEIKILVAVHIPPEITEGPGISKGVEGDEMSVSCKAEGLPPPQFQYYKDGSSDPLVTSERVKVDSKTGNLVFSPLKKEDEGRYTCFAHNDVGNRSLDGNITVHVKPTIFDFQNVSMKDGWPVSIICGCHGDPLPNMTIRKVETTETPSAIVNEDSRIILSTPEPRRANLTIESLTLKDSGDYVCRVENKFGSDEKVATLTVTYRPRFAHDNPKSAYIWSGKKRNITCDVESEPVPTITWLRNNSIITNNSTFHIFTEGRRSSLQVEVMENDQTWIYGSYICHAANEHGGNEIVIELIRATAPDSPRSVNISECSATVVTLDVEPPLNDGGVKVNGYHVEFSEKPIDTNVSIVGGTLDQAAEYMQLTRSVDIQDSNKIEIESLKPNTTYVFRVKAKNEVGVGLPRELTVTTEAIRKPNPLQITSDKQADAFTYTITWKKPITGGLPIKEYEMKYREVKREESGGEKFGDWVKFAQLDNPNRPMLTYDLVDLQPKTTYQLQIRSLNEQGWSDFNTEFQFHTREATPSEVASMQKASVGPGAIVGIFVVVFVVLLVIGDISCYFVNNCGVTMCICVHLCGKSAAYTKEKAMEEGERQCLKTDDDDKKEEKEETGALKEGIDGQKEEMDSAEAAVDIKSEAAEKAEKMPVV